MDRLTAEEISRYGRHLSLPEVGEEGQQKLKQSSVLIIGAGGLGGPAALYLAAAGIGRIGLVDFDRVEESNLQRQVIYGESDLGQSKVERAIARLRGLNRHVEVTPIAKQLNSGNAMEILEPWDLVIDGSDNFPTRYLVNDATVFLGKPNVYGSIFRFEGQATVFDPGNGPCYRCLYPEPPPPAMVPSCEEGGVLGVVPGIVGLIQATEALKLRAGIGSSLVGRLLLIDTLRMEFRELRIRRDPACLVCGESPQVKELIDYQGFCGMKENGSIEITPTALKDKFSSGHAPVIVDVREGWEWEVSHLHDARHIPLSKLTEAMSGLKKDDEIVVVCRSGSRSGRAVAALQAAGFSRVRNLSGGLARWSREIDPSMRVA
ncbi:MAG TPA: molybdopterin-synthase adenylyltransferase MoeB [Thermoanaerobaculia bacterium]|nr:molybdopterin-synthase adenylyltransferase MoeB [Thermoanaerobaculia bacterium]